MPQMHKYIIMLILSTGFTEPATAAMPGQTTPVITYEVKETLFNDTIEALGTLKANEHVDLTATVTERITRINFQDNQHVTKEDVLVEMDTAEEYAELSEQQSFLNEAKKQVRRLTPVVKRGAASESTLDEWKRSKLAAEARIKAIQSRIDKRIIKAPYDGVLGLRNISVGALVQPGTLITTVDDINVMKLDFSIPEVFIAKLTPGVAIQASNKAFPGNIFHGQVMSVDSRIDPITRSIQARAIINNSDHKLKPGLLMQVEILINPRQALVIPEEALILDGKKHFVLIVIEDNNVTTVEKREIQIGARQFGEVEIIEGLAIGENIVVHGTNRARPGAPIHIKATERNNETLDELIQNNNKAEE